MDEQEEGWGGEGLPYTDSIKVKHTHIYTYIYIYTFIFSNITNINGEQYGCAIAVATAGRCKTIVPEYASAAAPVGAAGGASSTAAASSLK